MENPQTSYYFFLSHFLLIFPLSHHFFNCLFQLAFIDISCLIFPFVELWKIQLTGIFLSCEYLISAIRSSFCSFKILSRMDLLYLICPVSAMPQALNFIIVIFRLIFRLVFLHICFTAKDTDGGGTKYHLISSKIQPQYLYLALFCRHAWIFFI